MLALEMEKTEVKGFMGKLLRENLFDEFEARAIEITAAAKITIDGLKESENEKPCFTEWSAMRPLIYEIVKLCSKPKYVKIIFSLKNINDIHTNAAALFLNLVYENDGVTFTTAAAQKEFALDKTLDTAWDTWIRDFFTKTNVTVTDRE